MVRTPEEMDQPVQVPKARGPNWAVMTPLIWAPMLPLIRISLKDNPVLMRRAFAAGIVAANVHALFVFSRWKE